MRCLNKFSLVAENVGLVNRQLALRAGRPDQPHYVWWQVECKYEYVLGLYLKLDTRAHMYA